MSKLCGEVDVNEGVYRLIRAEGAVALGQAGML